MRASWFRWDANLRTAVASLCIFFICGCIVWIVSRGGEQPIQREAPTLEGQLQVGTKLLHHVGSVCLGHTSPHEQGLAGSFYVWVKYDGEWSEGTGGVVRILQYDDEPQHWGAGQKALNSSSCVDAVDSASWVMTLPTPGIWYRFELDVGQHIQARRWHVVVATCVPEVVDAVDYRIMAVGALTKWEPGAIPPQPCPDEPLQKVKDVLLNFMVM